MGLIVKCLNRVTKSASHIKNQNRFSPLLNYLAALLLLFTPVYGAEVQSSGADSTLHSGAPAQDLTGLTLEELYNLDVIQLNVIGGHTHPAGQRMLGYEFMFMDMDGHLSGTRDVSESEILKLVDGRSKIVVSPIGGQGFLFGRGNQQISPHVLRRVGLQNLIIVSAATKIVSLRPRRLIVDTGDEHLDEEIRGYCRVLTSYREEMVVKVE